MKVKLNPKLAAQGKGFYDYEARQDIFPPRGKDGKPVVDHVFMVKETSFIREKLATRELIQVFPEASGAAPAPGPSQVKGNPPESPFDKGGRKIAIVVNGEKISEILVSADVKAEEIEDLVFSQVSVIDAIGTRGVNKFTVKADLVEIKTKNA